MWYRFEGLFSFIYMYTYCRYLKKDYNFGGVLLFVLRMIWAQDVIKIKYVGLELIRISISSVVLIKIMLGKIIWFEWSCFELKDTQPNENDKNQKLGF